MFELRPFERRNNHVAAYDPWDQMERAFFGDGSWGRGLSEFKTDIQDKGDSYLLEADLPGFKKEDIHVDVDGDTMTIRAERHSEHEFGSDLPETGGWRGEKSLIFQGFAGMKGRVAVWQRSAATIILALSMREC